MTPTNTGEALVMFIVFLVFAAVALTAMTQMFRRMQSVNHTRQEGLPVINTLTFDMNYTRQHIAPPTYVTFDPTNKDHVAAMLLLLHPTNPRQHPTLRFEYDATTFDNAYQHMLSTFVNHFASKDARALAKKLYDTAEEKNIKVTVVKDKETGKPVYIEKRNKKVLKKKAMTVKTKRAPKAKPADVVTGHASCSAFDTPDSDYFVRPPTSVPHTDLKVVK